MLPDQALSRSGIPCLRVLLFFIGILAPAALSNAQGSKWKHPDGTTHWYEVVAPRGGVTWTEAHAAAARAGGYLATVTSVGENSFVFSLVDDSAYWTQTLLTLPLQGPWLGGMQAPGAQEPLGGWGWSERESFAYSPWASLRPRNDVNADRVHYLGTPTKRASTWADLSGGARLAAYVVEYSGPFTRRTLGLLQSKAGAFEGYTLLSPLGSTKTSLIDMRGRQVHSWVSKYKPGAIVELLPNGNLLRAGTVGNTKFAPGRGGIVEEFDWQGNLVWQFQYSSSMHVLHHDVARLPNGNTLMIAWEVKTRSEAIAAGRNPDLLDGPELWPDNIIEVDPKGKIVWEWSVWDHLIQDYDATKTNYGSVGAHPELVDLNFAPNGGLDDWMHTNSITYNASLDQIMISVRHFNELWVIDHSTTNAEAASHKGGRSGKGGDLLYRWGNPQTYHAGGPMDQRLFWQHDSHWIEKGLPGAGNIMIFNNGVGHPIGLVSSVDEIVPPTVDAKGNYPRTGKAWGPKTVHWTWPKTLSYGFFAPFVSGSQRLPNGNTLICQGQKGQILEVLNTGEVVWEYRNPITPKGPAMQGEDPMWNPGGTSIFRAQRYAPDYPAFAKKTLTRGKAVESHTTALLANESSLHLVSRIGERVDLRLVSKQDAGRFRLVGTALAPGLIPVDSRFLRIAPGSLTLATLLGTLPTVFPGYVGSFDSNGDSTASMLIPELKMFVGLQLHTMFMTLDPAKPTGIGTISNTVVVNLTK
jgi:Arylsulfotransferase (ASST)